MIIYNENGNVIENPDMSFGYVEKKIIPVIHQYIVDEPAVTHEVIIKEYPETGGKDVAIVVDAPEIGHWITSDQNGNEISEFDGDLTAFAKDFPVNDTWEYGVFVAYSEEEIARRQEEEARLSEETEKREDFMQNGPDKINELESTQEDMVLLLADIVGGAA